MAKWSEEQDEIIREFAHLGAAECAKRIHQLTGIRHTEAATQRRASRLGVTLVKYRICPECGGAVPRLNERSGLCTTCNASKLLEQQREINDRLKAELIERKNDERKKRIEREYNAVRRDNLRKMRRLGVEPSRKRSL